MSEKILKKNKMNDFQKITFFFDLSCTVATAAARWVFDCLFLLSTLRRRDERHKLR